MLDDITPRQHKEAKEESRRDGDETAVEQGYDTATCLVAWSDTETWIDPKTYGSQSSMVT